MKVLRCDTDMKNYFESTKLVTAKFPGINVRADEYVYSHLMFVIERMMMKGLKYRLIHEDCKRTCKNGSISSEVSADTYFVHVLLGSVPPSFSYLLPPSSFFPSLSKSLLYILSAVSI